MAHNNKKTKTIFQPTLLALLVGSALFNPALAEQATDDTAEQEEATLEVIQVTARKTSENLQDVPVAVTSLGATDISERGLSSVIEVAQFSPNTTLQQSRGTNSTLTAFIRGVGQEDPLWGYEPGVGIYIDDVYVARPQGAVLDIMNIERIEVLRGPQGTLYGKNTIGGAVKYVTKAMSGDAEMAVDLGIGSYNQRDVKLTGQLPLVENKLYLGVGYANLQRDGFGEFLTSAIPGQDTENYNKDLQAARLTLEYRPSDELFFRLNYDKTDDKSNSKGGYRLVPSLLTNAPVPDSVYDSYTSLPTWNKVETEGLSLTADWMLSDSFTFKSVTSQRESYSPTNIDFDNTSVVIFDVPAIYDDEQFTQEFQLNYTGDKLTAVSGLYYYTADSCGVFDAILGVLGQSLGQPGLTREVGGCSNSDSFAAYSQGSYQLDEQWSVTAGLRYTKDDKAAVVRNGLIFNNVYPESGWIPGYVRPDGLTTPVVLDDEESWSKLTPKLGVEFKQTDDLMWFASFSQGFKSGTFNPRATTAEPAADPETVNSYELGMKSDWNRTVRVNATLFMLDHKDRQYISVIPDPTDASVLNQRLGNVGRSEATGAELEFTWAASADLEIYANLGLIDAEFEEAISFTPAGQPVDISDRFSITNTPETTGNIGFTYTTGMASGDVILTGNYSYRSDYSLVELDNLLTQDSYGLVNLGVTWYSNDGHWIVGLHGKNLTDEEYLVGNYAFVTPDETQPSGFQPGLGGDNTFIGYYGSPRTVTLNVGYRF